MPINAHPDYIAAEGEYHKASTPEEKLEKLKKMISLAPGHKGAENLRQQLTTRRKKLQEQIAKAKKSGKSSFKGIKKEDMQVVILGLTNSGKSTLLNKLTNASPKISEIKFTTKNPIIGMIKLEGINIQLIENPAIESSYYDKGLTNSADTLLLIINSLEDINKILPLLSKSKAKKIIAYNYKDKIDKRKTSAYLQSKKYNFVIINLINKENIDELKRKILSTFNQIRIYTKEPNKEKSPRPIIMKPGSNVKDVAEKILKGFSKNVKETKLWGPSSKFPGQKIGLKHVLKDLDVVEFKTR